MKKSKLFFVGLGACFAHTSAGAQTGESRIDITASSKLSYDSNTLGTNDPLVARAGLEKEDIKFTPFVALDISVPVGRQTAFLAGSIGYDFNHKNKQLDREGIDLTGGLELRPLSDCGLRLTTKFGRQQSDLSDFRQLVNVKNTGKRLGFDGGLSCSRPFGLTSSMGYGFEKTENSDPRRQLSNFRSHAFNASVGYAHPSLGEISVYANHRRGTYPNRTQIFAPLVAEKVKVSGMGLSFARDLGVNLKGRVSVGYTSVDTNTPGVPSFSGLSYSGDVTWRANDSFQTVFMAGRDAQQSNSLDINYSISDRFSFSSRYALNDQIEFNFGAAHVRRKFRESPLVPVLVARGKDSTNNFFIGTRYSPRGPISFALDVSAFDRNSAVRQFEYNKLLTSFTVRYRF